MRVMAGDRWRMARARELRRDQNEAERRVWHLLRDRRLGGLKFRRQHVLGRYIVDFVCLEAKLVIEIDGDSHVDVPLADANRTAVLERLGYRVIRFWNSYVFDPESSIGDMILEAVKGRPHPEALTPTLSH